MQSKKARSAFPWKIFLRVVLAQALSVLLAVGLSGAAARHFFRRTLTQQARSQLQDTLKAIALDAPKRPDQAWCERQVAGTSLRLVVQPASGAPLCEATSPRFRAAAGDESPAETLSFTSGGLVFRGQVALREMQEALGVFDVSLTFYLAFVAAALALFAVWSGRRLAFPIGRLLIKARDVLSDENRPERLHDLADLVEESYGELSDLESSLDRIRRDLEAKTESLSLEREELATLMAAISDAILAVDRDGVPLFFNSRFALLLESPREAENPEAPDVRAARDARLQSRSIRLWEMFREPDILESFKITLREGRTSSVKAIPIEQSGGAKRFYSLSVSPLRRADGVVYGAVGVFHDVTELKSAEQIRIDFVANVSHELRTPLTSIKGYTDTLIQDMAEGRGVDRNFLETIARNSSRLMNLIGDLLDLSSLESTDLLQKDEVRTEEITGRVRQQLQDNFAKRDQRLECVFDAPLVLADPKRLEQVLVNLLDNANKYTPVGGRIRVSWEPEDSAVLLKVSDDGPGIPPEHHPRLFERFYRVDKGRSRDQGGTGLGLAIVKHILQRHDGAVWVERPPSGRGTTFVCRFPA